MDKKQRQPQKPLNPSQPKPIQKPNPNPNPNPFTYPQKNPPQQKKTPW
jgi:hypothetical protein